MLEHSPLEECFSGDEHQPTPFSNSLPKILSLIEIPYLTPRLFPVFKHDLSKLLLFFRHFQNAVAFFVKCFCQIHLKEGVRCLARSSMNHQSKIKPKRRPTGDRLSVDCRPTVGTADVLTDASVGSDSSSLPQKAPFSKMSSFHTKTKSQGFQIPPVRRSLSKSSVFVTD